MSLEVGPIESYVSDSPAYTTIQYADVGSQAGIDINLADSNLWLVDNSLLDFDSQYDPSRVVYTSTDSYPATTSPMAQADSTSITGDVSMYTSSRSTNLAETNLSTLTPQSAADSGASLSAAAPSGSSLETQVFNDFSFDPTPVNPASPFYNVAYGGSSTSNPLISGGGAGAGDSGGEGSALLTSSVGSPQNPATALDPEAVPLELHSSLGVGVLALLVASRWLGQRRRYA